MGVGGQRHTPAALPPGKRPWYPLYRRLGRPQDWSGQVWKISPPLGFDPWTVQQVALSTRLCFRSWNEAKVAQFKVKLQLQHSNGQSKPHH